MASTDELQRRFSEAGGSHRGRSDLYAQLGTNIAGDPPIASMLTSAAEQQQLPVLLFAAVHALVLDETDSELARYYPTATPDPEPPDGAYPVFRRFCVTHEREIRHLIATRRVQTNEVGRCSLLVAAMAPLADAGQPIDLIDVGTSAGLNLLLDQFHYEFRPGGNVGAPSPVELTCGIRGEVSIPHRLPRIASRTGIDVSPLDPTDPHDRRWLLACIWPDQPDRFIRLRAALDLANDTPPHVVVGDALSAIDQIADVDATPGETIPVITNSWVLNYLTDTDRAEYVRRISALGATRDITWIFAESPGLSPGLPFPDSVAGEHITVVMRVDWRAGEVFATQVGVAHPHGYWLHAP